MATKTYTVVREVHEYDRFFPNYPEYNGYRMYMVEAPTGTGMYQKAMQYMVTREGFLRGQSLAIDEGSEILPVRERSGSVHLGGTKVVVYRPERYLSTHFVIKAAVNDGAPVEKFGDKYLDRKDYYLYEAEREGTNGYKGVLVRVFTKALHVPGMDIPVNETVGLHTRNSAEAPHYVHDMESKAYTDRIWKTLKRMVG